MHIDKRAVRTQQKQPEHVACGTKDLLARSWLVTRGLLLWAPPQLPGWDLWRAGLDLFFLLHFLHCQCGYCQLWSVRQSWVQPTAPLDQRCWENAHRVTLVAAKSLSESNFVANTYNLLRIKTLFVAPPKAERLQIDRALTLLSPLPLHALREFGLGVVDVGKRAVWPKEKQARFMTLWMEEPLSCNRRMRMRPLFPDPFFPGNLGRARLFVIA
mmetsp:Transcript_73351/g.132081  ORF Transcript_73351/g.132081 Transcript_73351/m.132081 type:complete len:214 (-) Transcript_73351:676-1317(-)